MTIKYLLTYICLIFLPSKSPAQNYNLIIGTYTTGKSEGIYVYNFDITTGNPVYKNKITGIQNPSYLTVSRDLKYLYSVNTTGKENPGGISAFSFDKRSGSLVFLNRVSAQGDNPIHISIHKNQKYVLVANYVGGNLSVTALEPDGFLGKAVQVIQHEGKGPNTVRQEKPHMHMVIPSPDHKYFFTTDLGTDRIDIYRYSSRAVKPLLNIASITVKPGSGPRHLIFHGNKKYLYALMELNGNIVAYRYKKGSIQELGTYNHIPENSDMFGGADIRISPDGKFLYASYRANLNELAIYSINKKNGALSFINKQPSLGIGPRGIAIDPFGNYLLVAHQFSDEVVIFKRNKKTGLLSMENKISIGNPVCLLFVKSN